MESSSESYSSTTSSLLTSSSSFTSSHSSPVSPNLASLPIMAIKDKIVEKIMYNRVTLVIGETGCGKSSQVPLFLREANFTPVICTQPRRFAVVAVAKMVADMVQSELGDEVGYHIGHSKVMSSRSTIIFKTAGVLLEEMREKGIHALKYKAIILDEVHERSVESDLVLFCVKQFLLRNKDMRLVLMSATADVSKYRDYFRDLGRDERVEVLAIPSSHQHTYFQRKVLYLEQVAELLEESPDSSNTLSVKYCHGTTPLLAKADIKHDVHKLIHQLVLYIHKNEPDIEKSILIFLPTYYSLEQQWFLLKPFDSEFKVHILHSSIDTNEALKAMKISKSHRKIILATNIAESSVTIPDVAYVIDSCRSLQVYWDGNRKIDTSELIWVSKSQSNQRKGRTGRTCDGQIYRLVTGSFYNELPDFEEPSILKLSLRLQVLLMCCAESKFINDPKALSQKALDPPDLEIVEDALSLLVRMKAINKAHPRGRCEPTFYGRVLSSLSLSFDASVLILKFGSAGMLREGILLGILMDMQPQPIIRPFGQENLFMEYTDSFYAVNEENSSLAGRKEVVFLANLCAYQFWERVFKDKHRLQHLKKLLDVEDTIAPQAKLSRIEEEWCRFHNLLSSSMNQISEAYNDILCSLHRYRPQFLAKSSGLPFYYEPYDFRHVCLLECQPSTDAIALVEDDEHNETKKCLAMPFVSSCHFQCQSVAEKFANIIKEIRIQHAEALIEDPRQLIDEKRSNISGESSICRYYVQGNCSRGNDCWFSHSMEGKRPVCKYFTSLQGCRNGDSCVFSHEVGAQAVSSELNLCIPEEEADAEALIKLFPTSSSGHILVLDDTDFHFSSSFSQHYKPSKIIATTSLLETTIFDPSLSAVQILWGIREPFEIFTSESDGKCIPWDNLKRIFWFPKFDSCDEILQKDKRLVQKFFEHLAVRILADTLFDFQVIVVMNNIRFSYLQVEKLGRDCFFFLKESFQFDELTFGVLPDSVHTKKSLVTSTSVCYVFTLHPPTDLQFGDYTSALHDQLHRNQ
ncbi:DExH-box ATP-dependent RNA helicase DExH8 isoform X1 [Amaranthus tricolor]|uniref:DExH-box ATP-dependent RNA helicase DExH8 isoform X1 n=3 Tax=Amaranthus tricolor TaxID=29722 RepID=UPI002584961F|nr:DExH-box ATP-dependent RNA helicase DExH8 isoform X1 [Amaranthus tricolor]